MNYNHPNKSDGTQAVMVMCALVFVVFSFLWLYFFQADIMYVAQHVLSGGKTQYGRTWGAILITLVLWLLQWGVFGLSKLRQRLHALTWFPSMLGLAVLTSVSADIDRHFSFGAWLWLVPLLLLLWGGAVMLARSLQAYGALPNVSFFSRPMWSNLLLMALMICGVAVCGNTNAVFHYRAHAEVALLQGDDEEALRVGQESLETDSCLMMVRMYALSRQGVMGERLFEYALVPTSDAMLPTTPAVRLQVYPADSLFRHLGAIPRRPMRPMEYLQALIRNGQAKPAAADYLLCGYLLDRNLDEFASNIGQYYTINDSLPRHYREALVLYTHQRSHPVLVYHDAVLDEDYADFQELEETYATTSERKGKMMESYANSYWYYYGYVGR